MNQSTFNKIYESISIIDFNDDDIRFKKTSKVNSLAPIQDFIEKRVKQINDSPLTEEEKATVELWRGIDHYDTSYIIASSLPELKLLLRRAHIYLGDEGNYNWIDTSQIKSFSQLFESTYRCDFSNFNGNIEDWDTSNVTNMNYTFTKCKAFNRDLSKWDFSNVKYMSGCFIGCNEEFVKQVKGLIDFSQIKTKYNIF